MKKLNITWEGVFDSTGYLFSFAKSLACAVKNSPYSELAEDIVATSGFAFRMWVSPDLCPSATSIWAFHEQKRWIENGGLTCNYIERLWDSDDIEEERRLAAIELIKQSIDNGIAAISWDIGVTEWGLIIGYDDETQKFSTLSITGASEEMDYALLGKRELPILNVLTITGKSEKSTKNIITDTLRLAKSHLTGEEWCDNAKGLEAYPALIRHFESSVTSQRLTTCDNPDLALSWNMEYFLGTYTPLKWFAWKFFEKYQLTELAAYYKNVYEYWQKAFDLKKSTDLSVMENRISIAKLLKQAEEAEKNALTFMK